MARDLDPTGPSDLPSVLRKALLTGKVPTSICAVTTAAVGPTRVLRLCLTTPRGLLTTGNLLLAGLPAPSLKRARSSRNLALVPLLGQAPALGACCLTAASRFVVQDVAASSMLRGSSFLFDESKTLRMLSVPVLGKLGAAVGVISIELRRHEDPVQRLPSLQTLAGALAVTLSSLAAQLRDARATSDTSDCCTSLSSSSSSSALSDSCTASPNSVITAPAKAASDGAEQFKAESSSGDDSEAYAVIMPPRVRKPFHEARLQRLAKVAAIPISPFHEHRRRVLGSAADRTLAADSADSMPMIVQWPASDAAAAPQSDERISTDGSQAESSEAAASATGVSAAQSRAAGEDAQQDAIPRPPQSASATRGSPSARKRQALSTFAADLPSAAAQPLDFNALDYDDLVDSMLADLGPELSRYSAQYGGAAATACGQLVSSVA